MSSRPSVDVVVPFRGTDAELARLLAALEDLRLGPLDTLSVVDNRPGENSPEASPPHVLRAPRRQSSYHARNRGAARGSAEWLLFIDADVAAPADLLDRYFAAGPPDDDVAVLAGAIHDRDAPRGARRPAAARYAFLRGSMAHTNTRARLGPFAKTANAAVRRVAFETIGGFRDDVRSGGDVDLCYRLVAAGWRLEFRSAAAVEHRGRERVIDLVRQQARHGSGTAWLDLEHPGFSAPFRWSSLLVSLLRGLRRGARARIQGDYDRALVEVLDPLTALAFHLGRLRSNTVRER